MDEDVSLDDARVLTTLIGLEVDLAAHNNALCGGVIGRQRRNESVKSLKHDYNLMVAHIMGLAPEEEG